MSQSIVLDEFMKIGDEVIAQASEDTKRWRKPGVPDGTKGVVVGFYRYEIDVCYSDLTCYSRSGIYGCNGTAIIQWENGYAGTYSPHDMIFADESLLEQRREDKAYRKAFEQRVWVRELPELPYWVGMTVRVHKPIFGHSDVVRIHRIDWLRVDAKCDDGVTPYPIYTVSPVDGSGGAINIRADDIDLICDQGNYYRWEHNREGLIFKDLKEELAFYTSKGFAKQVPDPASQNYTMSIETAIENIKAGIADYVRMSSSFFGANSMPTIYRIDGNDDLKARAREETIKGFSDIETLK